MILLVMCNDSSSGCLRPGQSANGLRKSCCNSFAIPASEINTPRNETQIAAEIAEDQVNLYAGVVGSMCRPRNLDWIVLDDRAAALRELRR
jgi:hypothetical protein